MTQTFQVILNGAPRSVAPDTTVADLVGELGLQPGRFAVEVNRAIVPRSTHAVQRLAAGDAIEIVTFVGGG